jgi:4-hydroxybenzoate polyprenyltransferase
MEKLLKIIDIFFLSRPLLLIPVWGFCIFGYYHGASFKNVPVNSLRSLNSFQLFLWFFIFSFSVASVYILNQLADQDVDAANKGLPLLAKRKVSVHAAWAASCVCAAIGVGVPLFRYPFLSLCSTFALILGTIYSFKPVRLSGRCFFDFLANAAGWGIIAFAAGWYMSGAPFSGPAFLKASAPYFFLMCAGSISSTIPDFEGDKKYGKNTTAVSLGILKAHGVAFLFICMTIVVSALSRDYIALTCAVSVFPLYALYYFKPDARIQEATYKIGGVLCMVLAAVLMPVLTLAAALVTALTFFYFRKRFHTTYPSLTPTDPNE